MQKIASHVKAVDAERSPVKEQMPVGLHSVQYQVDGNQDKFALDILVCNRTAEVLLEVARRARPTKKNDKRSRARWAVRNNRGKRDRRQADASSIQQDRV